ncbi:MAG TPA: hypothetical protein VEL07_02340 [Planctomycetota bacterium]|nr:hypothetical protein [Planctomycetota bacterium]
MRNSFFPIVMTLIIAAAAAALIPRASSAGREGPLINSGMFRLPADGRIRVATQEGMAIDNTVAVEHERDTRVGLEPDPWDCVAVVGEDRAPSTKALIQALAEDLTARGTLVVVNARAEHEQAPALAIPVDRILRITTVSAQPLPAVPGEPYEFTLRVRHHAARLPDDHPAAALQWAGGARDLTVTVAHRSRATGTGDRAWGPWWAAIGRSLASDVIAAVEPATVPGAPLPVDWTHRRPRWPDRLTDPPTDPVLRWHAAFEHDLVRGWTGRIDGTTTLAKNGERISAFAPIEKRLGSGEWEETSVEGSALRTWQKTKDDHVLQVAARDTGNGWDLSCWQEWREPAGVHDEWIDAATAGDALARDRLRRHLASQALPPDQQDAARALIATDADAAEDTMLARSTAGAEHLPRWMVLERGKPQSAPIRPLRLMAAGARVVWLVTPLRPDQRLAPGSAVGQVAPGVALITGSATELVVQGDVDAAVADRLRSAIDATGGPAQTLLTSAGATVAIPLPDGRIEATCADGRMTLTWK